MKIHTVFVTYNRLDLTKRAIESFLDTRTMDYQLSVVDNGSTDGTQEWLRGRTDIFTWISDTNRYPGWAANWGWSVSREDVTHLHRADNDFVFLPGWCEEVERMFSEHPNLGQLGLRTDSEEMWNRHNVGGNCVIRRELWDAGLRYDERPWPEIAAKVPGYTEDSFFSPAVVKMGWEWGRVERPCIRSISSEQPGDPDFDAGYYQQTWADRRGSG